MENKKISIEEFKNYFEKTLRECLKAFDKDEVDKYVREEVEQITKKVYDMKIKEWEEKGRSYYLYSPAGGMAYNSSLCFKKNKLNKNNSQALLM